MLAGAGLELQGCGMWRCILVIGWFVASAVSADTLVGRVVEVSDGDTIVLAMRDNQRQAVTLAGIDAPEMAQPYGQESREHLGNMVAGRVVTVEVVRYDDPGTGQIAGKVYWGGRDICLEQLSAGMAWHRKPGRHAQSAYDRRAYVTAEWFARAERRGLWQGASPVRPWLYRRR